MIDDVWRGPDGSFNRSQSAIKPGDGSLLYPQLCAFMNLCVLCACVGIDLIGMQPF